MPPKYNVNYFQFTGRTQPVNLLLEFGAHQHKQDSTSEDWNAIHEEILEKRFQLSELSMLEFKGKLIAESTEIFCYVANRINLSGSNDEDISKTNQLVRSLNQMFDKMGQIRFDRSIKATDKKRVYARYLGESDTQRTFHTIVKQLRGGNKFYLGDTITAADIFFICIIRFLISLFPKALAPYPGLEGYSKRILNNEIVKEYDL